MLTVLCTGGARKRFPWSVGKTADPSGSRGDRRAVGQFFEDHRPELRYAAGAQGQNHVTFGGCRCQSLCRLRERSNIPGLGSGSLDLFRQSFARHAFDWHLAGSIDIKHIERIRIAERGRKFLVQISRPAIAMRLKHHVNLAESALSGRGQGGANLGWMVPVIIDNTYAARPASQLKTPVHATEMLQREANQVDFDVETDAD